ncbi:MAG: hypothetical protein KUG82_06395 [Pseudomonadales bacterium]|nr:hypothetical protein [Pseudomonadales bacterium]
MDEVKKTKNWLRYWRNSLADAESGKGALTEKSLTPLLREQVTTFQNGLLANKTTLNYLFESEQKETQLVKVLIRPTIYISKYEHGQKHSSTRPDFISPILCSVWVSRQGYFYPAGNPTIPRDLLSPQTDEKLTLFDMESLDTFHTENEATTYGEQAALALVSLENNTDRRYQGWGNYYDLARELFKTLYVNETKAKIDTCYQKDENNSFYFTKVDDAAKSAQHILSLYDWLELNNCALPLLKNYSLGQIKSHQPCTPSSNSISLRVGHSNSQFPLAKAQRDSLTHVMTMKEGEILAINGPPGTGKTTFVLSAIASLWVKAALAETEPPIVIVASTNNQAVTNVIAAFGKDFEENDNPFSGRWIPDIKSYGGYFPAASKEKEAAALYQTKAFYESLEQPEFLDRAEAHFLKKAIIAFKDKSVQSIESIQTRLLKKIVSCHTELTQVETAWSKLNNAKQACTSALGNNPLATLEQSQQTLVSKEDELNRVIQDKKIWVNFCASESIWLLLFRWLPPVAHKLLLLRKLFIENTFADISKSLIDDKLEVTEVLTNWLDTHQKKVDELKQCIEFYRGLIDRVKQAEVMWLQTTSNISQSFPTFRNLPNNLDIDQVDDRLDITFRFQLFQLTVHYWEARWLIECRKLAAKGNDDWAGHKKKGLKSVRPRWRRRMMLTPCIVSTLHVLPSHMKYKVYAGDQKYNDEYLVGEIDLLIIDEAGQVSPEVAAASFALAKQALVIGDIHQIEPVRSLSRSVDIGNLMNNGVMTNENQYDQVSKTGATVVEGSAMKIAQRTSRYHYLSQTEPGMFLREHRRCYDEIISFSNDLCYQGLLTPKRGPASHDNLFPPMAYLHIDGRAESPLSGSRYNRLEATQVAAWLSGNRKKIETYYQNLNDDYKDIQLEDLVGVVTPFKAQQALIEKACSQQGIKTGRSKGELTVGTVHALQGAERQLILFSAVYSRHSDGKFIDMNNSMLNVAVSRAKDSFIVFGDMEVVSAASLGEPRHLLAQYLFNSVSNEIVYPISKRPDLLETCDSPKLINNAKEHDEYIGQLLQQSEDQIDMVSPWISVSRLQETGLYDKMVVASQRGVVVNLYTDYHFNSTTKNIFDESKAAKFQRSCEQLNSDGINVFVVNGVHSKLVMADKRFMSVGSFNWCSAARTGKYANMETSMIYSGNLVEEITLQVNTLKARLKKSYLIDEISKKNEHHALL